MEILPPKEEVQPNKSGVYDIDSLATEEMPQHSARMGTRSEQNLDRLMEEVDAGFERDKDIAASRNSEKPSLAIVEEMIDSMKSSSHSRSS